MKKFTLLLGCCLLTSNLLWAQIEKGTLSLSGGINADYTWAESDIYEGSSLSLNPGLAFMINDHFLVGATVGTFRSDDFRLRGNSIIQPEIRYYFNPKAEKNKYYASFTPTFNLEAFDNSAYNFSFGFNRFLNENIALDVNANYALIGNQFDVFTINFGLRSFMSRIDRNNWKTATSTFTKGNLLINGGFGRISIVDNFIQASLNPSVGLFLNERFLVGADLQASLGRNLDDSREIRFSNLSIAPFARYYFGDKQKNLRWFGQVGFTYAGTKTTVEGDFESSFSAFLLNSKWGANWFLTSNLAFEFALDIDYNFGTDAAGTFGGNFTNLGQDFDLQLPNNGVSVGASVSLKYFLKRKK